MEKVLTIAIPTYNRKQQLLRLLRSIEAQNCTELYSVVVSDNNSDYSVEEVINDEFDGVFRETIAVYNRPFNGGGDYNISSSFIHASTKLFWLIGDDDEILPGSIKEVIKKSLEHPDIPFFKFAMTGSEPMDEDIRLRCADDLVRCDKQGYLRGGILFMSNNIYNVELLKPYFSDVLYFGYCSACQIIPMMHCLVDSSFDVLLCKNPIVKYNPPEGEHWNYVKVVTQLSTILDINWGNNHREIKKIFRIICGYFGVGEFLLGIITISDKSYRRYVYWKGMHTVYAGRRGVLDLFAIITYRLEIITHIPFLSKCYYGLFKKQGEIQDKLREKAKTNPRIRRFVFFAKKHMPRLK